MFLKHLRIIEGNKVIREINFNMGLNLIIDSEEVIETGNGVGKTTVLKIIDFCLGGKAKKYIAIMEKMEI